MGSVGLALSAGLLVVFAAFIAFNVVSARRSAAEHRDEIAVEQALAQGDENTVVQAALELGDDPAAPARPDRRTVLVNGAKFVVGAVGIVVGAQLLVDNGSALARLAGVSERIIGVTIIAVGMMVQMALQAAELLKADGISARVLDMHTIKPLDTEAVTACINEIGKVITVEDHNILNGLGSAVCEVAAEMGKGIVKRIGVQDQYGQSAPYERLLAMNGITVENIVKTAEELQ